MMSIIWVHLGLAVIFFGAGYAMTTAEPANSAVMKESWEPLPTRSFQSQDVYLSNLAKSHRWKVNPKAAVLEADSVDVSDIKLVGVVTGGLTYALLEISGIVDDFEEGEIILPDTQVRLVEINRGGVRLTDVDREFELLLYPDREND
jgi:hypothetical protein